MSSLAIARVTQPHTSSKVFAVCVRSSTVSSTRVRGGLEPPSVAATARADRCKLIPSAASDMAFARNCHVDRIVRLVGKSLEFGRRLITEHGARPGR